MVAVSLLFRYADFVERLGGSEQQLGWITGLGMCGAIVARCFQGMAIDRYGAGRIWLLSLVLLVGCLLSHLLVTTLQPPLVHGLRVLYTVSLAGAFGASITYVSLKAPPKRMGEMIGMLGSSGFVGMAIGPLIGDRLFAQFEGENAIFLLFMSASLAGSLSFFFTLLATWGDQAPAVESKPRVANPIVHMVHLVRQYHPGLTLLVGFAMGVGIGMPSTFLATFASEKGFSTLGWFFFPYAVVAFVVRIFTRKFADRWGTRPAILIGLSCMACSMLAYLVVEYETALLLPAALAGFAHAFLFPATVAEGNHAFPTEFRGLATNLTLTMFDVGMLLGQPAFGWTVETTRRVGGHGYFVAFSLVGGFLLVVALIYSMRRPQTPSW